MHCRSLTPLPLPTTSYYPIPISQHHCRRHHYHLKNNNKKPYSISLSIRSNNIWVLNNCQEQDKTHTKKQSFHPPTNQNTNLYDQLYSLHDSDQNPKPQIQKRTQNHLELKRILVNMWWSDFKSALGQRINIEGIVSSAVVLVRDKHLALPHMKVKDITYIDWVELHRRGFRGVVFDKDNTLTKPYSLKVWAPVNSSVEQCKAVFGNGIAVFSNSAGLLEYDHNGLKAKALERAIGIKVIRHGLKKPAGTAEEIEKQFGCESSQLIMVGDRPFTDIVFGNRNGFLTILTEPLSLPEEPFIVRQVRKLEVLLVNYWSRRGLKPKTHVLLSDPMQCVKDPSEQQNN